jgi:hypothetical protein
MLKQLNHARNIGQEIFDLILYVPPTKSGDLVKNFALKEIGRYLNNLGASKIAPLVIARTLGGDLV